MNTLETLEAARELLSRAWTKGCAARDANGLPTSAADSAAVCWCAWGALRKVGGQSEATLRLSQVLGINPAPGGSILSPLFDWNDTSELADVLAAFDRAIELERTVGAG